PHLRSQPWFGASQNRRGRKALSLVLFGTTCRLGMEARGFILPPGGRSRDASLAAATASLLLVGPSAASAAAVPALFPPAPSGIDVLPEAQQQAVFALIFAVLGLLTWLVTGVGFRSLRAVLPQ
ncbi:unnamed protein product, partial [Polarella glacialis]